MSISDIHMLLEGNINPSRLKTVSPEYRDKISAGLKGRVISPQTRAKMSEANKGKILSAEHCAKISAGLSSAWSSGRRTVTVSVMTPDGLFASNKKAAKHYGISCQGMRYRCGNHNYPDFYNVKK